MPDPVVGITVEFTAWLTNSRTPSPPTAYVTVTCSGLRADATGRIVATGEMRCRGHNNDSNDTSGDNTVQALSLIHI